MLGRGGGNSKPKHVMAGESLHQPITSDGQEKPQSNGPSGDGDEKRAYDSANGRGDPGGLDNSSVFADLNMSGQFGSSGLSSLSPTLSGALGENEIRS